jgi:hypothetical protein
MRLTSAGELCVGRTTAYGAGFLVNVEGNIYASAAIVAGSSVTATQLSAYGASNANVIIAGINSGSNNPRFFVKADESINTVYAFSSSSTGSDNLSLGSGGGTSIYIKAGGNVGINTTSPSNRLDVLGTAASPNLTGSNAYARFYQSGGFANITLGALASGSFAGWLQSSDGVGTALPLAINPSGGNVCIGTTSTSYKLEVAGVVRIQDTLSISNGESGQAIFTNNSTAVSVSTTTALGGSFSMGGNGAFVIVYGASGSNVFIDTIIAGNTGTPTVLSSTIVSGVPSLRTYSTGSNRLQLAMASGTYDVRINILRQT